MPNCLWRRYLSSVVAWACLVIRTGDLNDSGPLAPGIASRSATNDYGTRPAGHVLAAVAEPGEGRALKPHAQ